MNDPKPASGNVGAAGEAAVLGRLLREGFDVARPVVDRGADLVVLSEDLRRAVPIQVKTLSTPSVALHQAWFTLIDVVLILVWLRPGGEEFFVFDGLAGVEAFLGDSRLALSWTADRQRWVITDMSSPGQRARLVPFANDWSVIRRRLGLLPVAGPPTAGFRLTRHAAERVDAGEVEVAWIAATLDAPDRTAPDHRRPGITLNWRAIPEFGGRVLRVAHRPENGQLIVVTAFFDRGSKAMSQATNLGARASYDAEADAIAIRFPKLGGRYAESEEVAPGLVLDFDAEGKVIGVQLLAVQALLTEGHRDTLPKDTAP